MVVRRTGMLGFLHALFSPGSPHTAHLEAECLRLSSHASTDSIQLCDVVSVDVEPGILSTTVSVVRRDGARRRIGGLSAEAAARLARAASDAREESARALFAARSDAIADAGLLLRRIREPAQYVRSSAFLEWLQLVDRGLSWLPARPPKAPEVQDAVRLLQDLQAARRTPEAVRAAANEAFVRDELERMRAFLDQVESRPLTSAQRRAVVVDEDRNLVVAAAGSGKTSVIVAKAAHLVHRGLCPPAGILMLAFARDAAREMRERVSARIPGDAGRAVTVTTFHALGLSIIGQAEERRPSIAKEAEDSTQMAKLVKGAVSTAMHEPRFASTMMAWFRSHFAPYRSHLEFKTQGEYITYIREHEIRSLKGDEVRSYS